MKDVGKILPVDAYKTYIQNSLPTDYLASLTHFYQPLLGIEATCLYQFLLAEANLYNDNTIQTHHMLMTYLNRPLDVVYQSRLKLEAFGLLKTYRHSAEDKEIYTYVLTAPFSPKSFLEDPMLSELLYREIGEKKFKSFKELYRTEGNVQLGKEITASFDDVFQTVQQPHPTDEASEEEPVEEQGIQVKKMDFTYLQQVLLNKMIPAKRVLTETNKRIISQTKQLYYLDQYEIEKALLWALTDENTLQTDQFREACNDLFKAKYNQPDIKLEEKKSASVNSNSDQKPMSREQKLAKHLENISPRQLLEDLSAGKNASAKELNMINEIMTKQNLKMPVMNVAVYYCLLQSNMKLSKPYLETIATHWSRLGIQSADQAMRYASEEIQPKTNGKQIRTTSSKRGSNEIIPDWFKDRKKRNDSSQEQGKADEMDEKERKEMLEILKRHSSKSE